MQCNNALVTSVQPTENLIVFYLHPTEAQLNNGNSNCFLYLRKQKAVTNVYVAVLTILVKFLLRLIYLLLLIIDDSLNIE